ncbi:hypothetical protein [Deinococcus yavapaiensis]|uniref:Tetratricopeptide repeat protein n=1 Tax=Deinococcus yavapaiensis KR-236 TaxID=694435 RepID=A0A318SBH4_9DEIO|nr:hypothetical protein [Deinococcus yavapaiensis]PYE54551.1 hypothetical protein DES52_105189 [Deinococcus yavapaiensis KR-236]
MKRTWPLALLTLTLVVGALERGGFAQVAAVEGRVTALGTSADEAYAYGTPAFARLVRESYEGAKDANLVDFDVWLERAYASTRAAKLPGREQLSLRAALATRKAELNTASGEEERTRLQRDTAAWLHKAIKAMIPRFSLERGFEFANAVRLGERQCLLQSVLISGLMQSMDLNAGTAMVWRNDKGVETNLGHVTAVVRLANGRALLVDASDPQPFTRHQGLLLRVRNGSGFAYRFVRARYGEDDEIRSYQDVETNRSVAVKDARLLAYDYVRSQFDYYRGERAPSGFMGKSTKAGLAVSEGYLTRATKLSADNPLAALVLGHVYREEGQEAKARAQYERAWHLYEAEGHVPPSAEAALRWAKSAKVPAHTSVDGKP